MGWGLRAAHRLPKNVAAGMIAGILLLAGCSGQSTDAASSSAPVTQATASDGTVFNGTYAQDYQQAYDSATSERAKNILRDGDLNDITSLEGPIVVCVGDVLEPKYGSKYQALTPVGFSESSGGLDVLPGTLVSADENYHSSQSELPDTEENRDIQSAIETCKAQYDVTLLSDLAIKTHRSVK
ncbi:MAG: hypothetical protein PUF51_00220 [Bifidobacteriaceae bacterium]|nr:hypothetical protein [Bifidobacteriaceae bacterium]